MRVSSGSTNGSASAGASVPVFAEMPELLGGVPPAAAAELAHVRVPLIRAGTGRWIAPKARGGCEFGLLVTEGVLVRRVRFDRRTGAEVLGSGDLIRPWARQVPLDTLPTTTEWQVLDPIALAVLDSNFGRCVAHSPQIAATLLERSTERARMLAFQQVASHVPGLEGRLIAILWALADRWGRVTAEGVVLPIRLTHATLAELVGASRPSVSSALKLLERAGEIDRHGEGWLLHGEPPLTLEGQRASRAVAPIESLAVAV